MLAYELIVISGIALGSTPAELVSSSFFKNGFRDEPSKNRPAFHSRIQSNTYHVGKLTALSKPLAVISGSCNNMVRIFYLLLTLFQETSIILLTSVSRLGSRIAEVARRWYPLTLTDDHPASELSLGRVMCADLRPATNGMAQRKHLFSNARDAVEFNMRMRSADDPRILRPYWCLFCEGVHLTSKNPPLLHMPPLPSNPDLRTWTGKKKDKKRRSRCRRKGHLWYPAFCEQPYRSKIRAAFCFLITF